MSLQEIVSFSAQFYAYGAVAMLIALFLILNAFPSTGERRQTKPLRLILASTFGALLWPLLVVVAAGAVVFGALELVVDWVRYEHDSLKRRAHSRKLLREIEARIATKEAKKLEASFGTHR